MEAARLEHTVLSFLLCGTTRSLKLTDENTSTVEAIDQEKLVCFLDLETTGLDHKTDVIIEIGMVLCLGSYPFEVLGEFEAAIRIPPKIRVVDISSEVIDMHGKNGLFKLCLHGEVHTIETVERDAYMWLKELNVDEKEIYLGGSGVSHFDYRFLEEQMPALEELFYYKFFDVSVFRDIMRAFDPSFSELPFISPHRALHDAKAARTELLLYGDLLQKKGLF